MHSIVEALVLVTKCCRFEGWLLNVECQVDSEKIPLLRMFIRHLTKRIHEEIPDGMVLWYDSVVSSGMLLWQNELNERNIMFFNECDGILINYTWNQYNLERTARIVNSDEEAMAKIFIGIDVFGRGQTAKFHTVDVSSAILQFTKSKRDGILLIFSIPDIKKDQKLQLFCWNFRPRMDLRTSNRHWNRSIHRNWHRYLQSALHFAK